MQGTETFIQFSADVAFVDAELKMKNRNLVRIEFSKVAVAVLLLLPSVNHGESILKEINGDPSQNALNNFPTQLARVQGDIQAGYAASNGAPNTQQMSPEEKKMFNLWVSVRGMKEAIAQFNEYREKIANYNKMKKDAQSNVDTQLAKRVNDAKKTEDAANAMVANSSGVAQQVGAKLDPNQLPDGCKTVDVSTLKQDLAGFDNLVTRIQTKMRTDGQDDRKKAEDAFDKNLAAVYADRMGKVGGDVQKLIPDGMEQLLAASKDPKMMLQFIQKNVSGIKDAAQAARVETWAFFLEPKNGILAKLKTMKNNDAKLAATSAEAVQMIDQQAGRVAADLQTVSAYDANNCRTNKKKFSRQTQDMLVGYGNLGVNGQAVAQEEKLANDIKQGANCTDTGSQAATRVTSAAKTCEQNVSSETKNPENLRVQILTCLQTVLDSANAASNDVKQGPEHGCIVAANAITGQKEDSARADAIAAAKNPNAGQQNQPQGPDPMALAMSMNSGSGAGGAAGGINPAAAMMMMQNHGGPQQSQQGGRPVSPH